MQANQPQQPGQPQQPQEVTAVPPPPQAPYPPAGQPPQPHYGAQGAAVNPGESMGMAALIMAFIFSPAGLILGIVSRSRSKASGMQPVGLATAAVWVSGINMILGVIGIILLIIIGATADEQTSGLGSTNGNMGSSARLGSDNTSKNSKLADKAEVAAKKAEAYFVLSGDYPKFTSDFAKYPETKLADDFVLYNGIITNTNVTYIYCGKGAAQVVYYGKSKDDLHIKALGTASKTEQCARQM